MPFTGKADRPSVLESSHCRVILMVVVKCRLKFFLPKKPSNGGTIEIAKPVNFLQKKIFFFTRSQFFAVYLVGWLAPKKSQPARVEVEAEAEAQNQNFSVSFLCCYLKAEGGWERRERERE